MLNLIFLNLQNQMIMELLEEETEENQNQERKRNHLKGNIENHYQRKESRIVPMAQIVLVIHQNITIMEVISHIKQEEELEDIEEVLLLK